MDSIDDAPTRLFIGIDLSSDCKRALQELDPRLSGLRWLPPEQLHLTLSFLGNVGASGQKLLAESLSQVHVPAFFLPLRGIGSFNAGGRLSVVWIGVGRGHPHLFALHQRVQDAVLHAGLEPDLKPFHPHVTVARAKGPISRQSLQSFLRKYSETEFGMIKVTEFILFSSTLSPEGATHTPKLHVPLS